MGTLKDPEDMIQLQIETWIWGREGGVWWMHSRAWPSPLTQYEARLKNHPNKTSFSSTFQNIYVSWMLTSKHIRIFSPSCHPYYCVSLGEGEGGQKKWEEVSMSFLYSQLHSLHNPLWILLIPVSFAVCNSWYIVPVSNIFENCMPRQLFLKCKVWKPILYVQGFRQYTPRWGSGHATSKYGTLTYWVS